VTEQGSKTDSSCSRRVSSNKSPLPCSIMPKCPICHSNEHVTPFYKHYEKERFKCKKCDVSFQRPVTKKCIVCGKPFEAYTRRQKICSMPCQKARYEIYNKEEAERRHARFDLRCPVCNHRHFEERYFRGVKYLHCYSCSSDFLASKLERKVKE